MPSGIKIFRMVLGTVAPSFMLQLQNAVHKSNTINISLPHQRLRPSLFWEISARSPDMRKSRHKSDNINGIRGQSLLGWAPEQNTKHTCDRHWKHCHYWCFLGRCLASCWLFCWPFSTARACLAGRSLSWARAPAVQRLPLL